MCRYLSRERAKGQRCVNKKTDRKRQTAVSESVSLGVGRVFLIFRRIWLGGSRESVWKRKNCFSVYFVSRRILKSEISLAALGCIEIRVWLVCGFWLVLLGGISTPLYVWWKNFEYDGRNFSSKTLCRRLLSSATTGSSGAGGFCLYDGRNFSSKTLYCRLLACTTGGISARKRYVVGF